MIRFKINHHYENQEHKNLIILYRTAKSVLALVNDNVYKFKLRESNHHGSEYIIMPFRNGHYSEKIIWFANTESVNVEA